jgi:hypothetical protein
MIADLGQRQPARRSARRALHRQMADILTSLSKLADATEAQARRLEDIAKPYR